MLWLTGRHFNYRKMSFFSSAVIRFVHFNPGLSALFPMNSEPKKIFVRFPNRLSLSSQAGTLSKKIYAMLFTVAWISHGHLSVLVVDSTHDRSNVSNPCKKDYFVMLTHTQGFLVPGIDVSLRQMLKQPSLLLESRHHLPDTQCTYLCSTKTGKVWENHPLRPRNIEGRTKS